MCRFGGAGGQLVPAAMVDVTGPMAGERAAEEVQCSTPTVATPRSEGIELTLNAQQYTQVALPFTFHAPLRTSAVAPHSGPVLGGTRVLVLLADPSDGSLDLASVAAFDPSCVCRFRETESPAALASRFVLPPVPRPPNASANGSNASANGSDASANGSDAFNGSDDLNGSHAVDGSDASVSGTNTSTGDGAGVAVRCTVPALGVPSGDAAPVSVSLNAQDFCASGASFRVYPQLRVSSVHPSAGPLAGSTTLTVHGPYPYP